MTATVPSTLRIGVIGLGAMGLGMANSLVRAGFDVAGCDLSPERRDRFRAAGGTLADTPAKAAQGADVVFCVVINAAQTEDVLFGAGGVADALPPGSVFISCATMDPKIAERLGVTLDAQGKIYLDAPISGGAARAEAGELSVMASGDPRGFERAGPALDAVSAKLFALGDAPGQGSTFKMINQLLTGVHIAAASEAMVLAAKQGLDLHKVYEVITASAGNSWMFENRMAHVLSGDYTPLSAVDIFVKDLGIVLDTARASHYPAPLAAAAHQMYLAASGAGMGGDDDSSLARLYAQLSGAVLPPRIDR